MVRLDSELFQEFDANFWFFKKIQICEMDWQEAVKMYLNRNEIIGDGSTIKKKAQRFPWNLKFRAAGRFK